MPSQNTITCSECKTPRGTTNVRLKKLIKQYGSHAKLNAAYVCRSCKSGTSDIKQNVNKGKKLPTSKVICSKCLNKFGTTKVRMKKLIGQYGSLEAVHSTYVCRTCRKEHNIDRAGRMKPVKRKRKPKILAKYVDEEGNITLPSWMSEAIDKVTRPLSAEEYKSYNVCNRPDLWATYGFCPNDCPFHLADACGCIKEFKKVKKKKKKKNKKAKKNKKSVDMVA